MIRVKICGITRAADARAAAMAGADALGFNFVKTSPRYLTRERARAIISALPPFVTPVGIFADSPIEEITEICEYSGIRTVQLHGMETPGDIDKLHRYNRIKAVRVGVEADLKVISRYNCEAILLDTLVVGRLGGTGQTFNWEWAREVTKQYTVILAGGLNPDNVAEAIRAANPYAVDVAGGVESEPGIKDRKLMAEFISEAKQIIV